MKKALVFILLFAFVCGGVFAQSRAPVTWSMAVMQNLGSSEQSFSPRLPINLKSGDMYSFYVKSDSPGFCYVILQNSDEVSSIIFSGPLPVGRPVTIMEDEKDNVDFTVPAGTGNIRYYMVVSSTPKPSLERYWNQGAGRNLTRAQQSALIDEVLVIRNSLSNITETPEKPVEMGGAVRGGRGDAPMAYQYEGQDTYVRTINIRY